MRDTTTRGRREETSSLKPADERSIFSESRSLERTRARIRYDARVTREYVEAYTVIVTLSVRYAWHLASREAKLLNEECFPLVGRAEHMAQRERGRRTLSGDVSLPRDNRWIERASRESGQRVTVIIVEHRGHRVGGVADPEAIESDQLIIGRRPDASRR